MNNHTPPASYLHKNLQLTSANIRDHSRYTLPLQVYSANAITRYTSIKYYIRYIGIKCDISFKFVAVGRVAIAL